MVGLVVAKEADAVVVDAVVVGGVLLDAPVVVSALVVVVVDTGALVEGALVEPKMLITLCLTRRYEERMVLVWLSFRFLARTVQW